MSLTYGEAYSICENLFKHRPYLIQRGSKYLVGERIGIIKAPEFHGEGASWEEAIANAKARLAFLKLMEADHVQDCGRQDPIDLGEGGPEHREGGAEPDDIRGLQLDLFGPDQ